MKAPVEAETTPVEADMTPVEAETTPVRLGAFVHHGSCKPEWTGCSMKRLQKARLSRLVDLRSETFYSRFTKLAEVSRSKCRDTSLR